MSPSMLMRKGLCSPMSRIFGQEHALDVVFCTRDGQVETFALGKSLAESRASCTKSGKMRITLPEQIATNSALSPWILEADIKACFDRISHVVAVN